VKVAGSKEEALALAGDAPEIIVFGGAEIFKQFIADVDRIYLTQVNADVGGDTYFDFDPTEWRVLDNVEHSADERHAYSFNFVTLERIHT
jgi:dihydrofolate reductase